MLVFLYVDNKRISLLCQIAKGLKIRVTRSYTTVIVVESERHSHYLCRAEISTVRPGVGISLFGRRHDNEIHTLFYRKIYCTSA